MKNDKIWKSHSIQDAKFEISKKFTTIQFTYQIGVKGFAIITQVNTKKLTYNPKSRFEIKSRMTIISEIYQIDVIHAVCACAEGFYPFD